jgi:hypothetical protein
MHTNLCANRPSPVTGWQHHQAETGQEIEMAKIIDPTSKYDFCFWDSEKNAPIREAARLAYRANRIKAQIKWAPEGVDPDDIDPSKFAPGGCYYNAPELVERLKNLVKDYPKMGGLDLLMPSRAKNNDAPKTLEYRLNAYSGAKFWASTFGGAK